VNRRERKLLVVCPGQLPKILVWAARLDPWAVDDVRVRIVVPKGRGPHLCRCRGHAHRRHPDSEANILIAIKEAGRPAFSSIIEQHSEKTRNSYAYVAGVEWSDAVLSHIRYSVHRQDINTVCTFIFRI